VEFTAAKVVSNVKDAEMLHRVVVDVGDLAAGYSKGGQFLQIKVRPAARNWLVPQIARPVRVRRHRISTAAAVRAVWLPSCFSDSSGIVCKLLQA
jgi:hypothetical protein